MCIYVHSCIGLVGVYPVGGDCPSNIDSVVNSYYLCVSTRSICINRVYETVTWQFELEFMILARGNMQVLPAREQPQELHGRAAGERGQPGRVGQGQGVMVEGMHVMWS